MNKKMYAVNWHRVGDVFSHCTVTTITVTREGVLPGCTGVTITATDHEGRKFQGSPDNYHDTEAKAWAEVKVAMSETIRANESSIAKLVNETNALREYLTKVGAGELMMSHPTTERRVIPEDVRKVMEMVLREVEAVANDHHHPRYTRLDEAITALRNALNAAPKGEV